MKGKLKKIISIGEVLFVKQIETKMNKSMEYIIDTFDDDTYMCYCEERRVPIYVVDAQGLRRLVESDKINTYKFTKRAYAQCEHYFGSIRIIVA